MLRPALLLLMSFWLKVSLAQISPNLSIKSIREKKVDVTTQDDKKYYPTINYFRWDRKKGDLEKEKVKLNSARDSLAKASDPDSINKYEEKITISEKKIVDLKKKVGKLRVAYEEDYITQRGIFFPSEPRSVALFNLLNQNDGKWYSAISSTGINLGNSTASIYSELIKGSLSIFHISFGTLLAVSSTDDDEKAQQEEAFQRLALSGGNTVLRLEYPLIYLHNHNNAFNLLIRVYTKASGDIPKFGTRSDSFAGSLAYGGDIYINIGGDLKGKGVKEGSSIRGFAYFNFGRYKGNNIFKDNLGIETTALNFGQLSLGIIVNNSIKISFITNTLSSVDLLRSGRIIGGGELLKK